MNSRQFLSVINLCYFNFDLGLIDVLTLEKLIWDSSSQNNFTRVPITAENDNLLWEETMKSRQDLIDRITTYDDDLANIVISSESLDNVKTQEVTKALRKITAEQVNYSLHLNFFLISYCISTYFKK